MSLTYNSWFSQFFNLVSANCTANGSSVTDSNWLTELPGVIDYAEQRIYRDLDLLATRYVDATASLSSGVRSLTLPTGTTTFLVVEGINVFAPSSLGSSNGSRVQVTATSRPFIDAVYGVSAAATSSAIALGVPEFFAMQDNKTVLFGPVPDAAYPVEIVGTGRPTPLSAGNSSTILTQMLPDLFMAGCMVKAAAFMRDDTQMADAPAQGAGWEAKYARLLQSAQTEEFRKKQQAWGWTNQLAAPNATPQTPPRT
jgi:hypothetical protein